MRYTQFVIFTFLLLVCACAGKGDEVTNPNGMSELSSHMEEMYEILSPISKDLKAGKPYLGVEAKKESFFNDAAPSDADTKNEHFNSFSTAFFHNYNGLNGLTSVEQQIPQFNLVIKSCLNCHNEHCPGPIVRIKKLMVSVN